MARRRKKKDSDFDGSYFEQPEFKSYKKGTLLGALLGATAGLIMRKKFVLTTIAGALLGGYVSYLIYKDDSDMISLKNFKEKETPSEDKNDNDE